MCLWKLNEAPFKLLYYFVFFFCFVGLRMACRACDATHCKTRRRNELKNTHPEFLCVCNVLISTIYYCRDAADSSSAIATWCDVLWVLCNNWSWCSHRRCNRNFDHVWNRIRQHRCMFAVIRQRHPNPMWNAAWRKRNEKKRIKYIQQSASNFILHSCRSVHRWYEMENTQINTISVSAYHRATRVLEHWRVWMIIFIITIYIIIVQRSHLWQCHAIRNDNGRIG